MPAPVITLLTDFGSSDHYAAAMKGVMIGICPEARLIDISHDLPPHDVLAGALELAAAYKYFPAGTVFLVVVDPGVGSTRRGIAAEDLHPHLGDTLNNVFFVNSLGFTPATTPSTQGEDSYRTRNRFHGLDLGLAAGSIGFVNGNCGGKARAVSTGARRGKFLVLVPAGKQAVRQDHFPRAQHGDDVLDDGGIAFERPLPPPRLNCSLVFISLLINELVLRL